MSKTCRYHHHTPTQHPRHVLNIPILPYIPIIIIITPPIAIIFIIDILHQLMIITNNHLPPAIHHSIHVNCTGVRLTRVQLCLVLYLLHGNVSLAVRVAAPAP